MKPTQRPTRLARPTCPARPALFAFAAFLAISTFHAPSFAADWPMWRHDAGRTAASPEELPKDLALQWVLRLPAPAPAWPLSQTKLQFDLSYEPVVMGQTLFVPSMVRDSLAAYDTETGRLKWRFHAEGPVRFAPLAAQGKVYFASDDGCLYCLDAEQGALRWKFRGGPSDHKILGNDRLISLWPARGAPVLFDGVIYFAAGIWPFMGTFIHALDPQTGAVLWTNSGSAAMYIKQQHDSPAFAGVAPQGCLAATADTLLVSGGRTVPAAYDRRTGKFLYYDVASRAFDKDAGGHDVATRGALFVNNGAVYALADGKPITAMPASVLAENAAIGIDRGTIVARALSLGQQPAAAAEQPKAKAGKGKQAGSAKANKPSLPKLWDAPAPDGIDRIFIQAGSRLYAGGENGAVAALEIPAAPADAAPPISWQAAIQGEPWSMLAANGKLFVVTRQGSIYCFAAPSANQPAPLEQAPAPLQLDREDGWREKAKAILAQTSVTDGYCLVAGVGGGRLAEELALQSNLRVIAVDRDPAKVQALRARWDDAGLYGARLSIIAADLLSRDLPPYFASLACSEDPASAGLDQGAPFLAALFHVLRPYGGAACLSLTPAQEASFPGWVNQAKLENAEVAARPPFTLLTRAGALPGAADWTHQYADPANTVVSRDQRVKAPLSLLWFGGPPNDPILPRHGHGPAPHVVDGRLFIEGPDLIRAVDIYTGRLLWETPLPRIGQYYDNTNHQPGANAIGANYVSVSDGIYVAYGERCLRLDPATGKTLNEFRFPTAGGPPPNWGHMAVSKDLLVAAVAPIDVQLLPGAGEKRTAKQKSASKRGDKGAKGKDSAAAKAPTGETTPENDIQANARYAASSITLGVMDRHSGNLLWRREAAYSFRHNAIAVSDDKVFCLDGMTDEQLGALKRRGLLPQAPPRLLALDARSGRELWSAAGGVFGTWLSYSPERDIVLLAGSRGPDRAPDEIAKGMAAYRGADGKLLWKNDVRYSGPCMIRHDAIITQTGGPTLQAPPAKAYSLLTGEEITRTNPLTGETVPWSWLRFKGCNTAIASEHLMTFRSAAASYVDLETGQGTASLGGFKSGCTSNLIVAGGLLNAPDYTRTCICSYQNQASLALVPAADDPAVTPYLETWSFDYYPAPAAPAAVRRVGLNLGAPGNRFAPDGVLWLECPSVGGPSPDLPVKLDPPNPRWLRYHASRLPGEDRNWVAASGAVGLTSVSVWPFLQPQQPAEPSAESSPEQADSQDVEAYDHNAFTLDDPEVAPPQGRFDPPRNYTVRLYFAELEGLNPGQRVFNVLLQGKPALANFDVAAAAGGPNRVVVREFKAVPIETALQVSFQKVSGADPLLCGIELLAD